VLKPRSGPVSVEDMPDKAKAKMGQMQQGGFGQGAAKKGAMKGAWKGNSGGMKSGPSAP